MLQIPTEKTLFLKTPRLQLEPITAGHATEMAALLSSPSLYAFTGGEPPTASALKKQYVKWEKRVSPDKTELWLNWAARRTTTKQVVGHFQAGVKAKGRIAQIAFVVGKKFQKKGYATEGAKCICAFLEHTFRVTQIESSAHPRNEASLALLTKLGFRQGGLLENGEILHLLL